MSENNKKLLKSILRISTLVIAAIIIGLNVYNFNASRLAGNKVPMPFGVGAAVVLSGSMEPEFSVGDLLIIKEQDVYEVGDIVVFQSGKMIVTHRIVSIDGEEVVTRGDANNTEDDPIKLEQIKGEVVSVIPFVGDIVNAIKSPIGTLCIIGIAVFLLERSFRSEKEKDKEKIDAIKAEIEKLKQNRK